MPLPEKALIAEIRRMAKISARGRARGAITTGIGDDCAILGIPPGSELLVTTDFTLEGIHFRREWHPPEVVGHRCLTRGLSDIAAMGGEPIAAFLSLALPRDLPQSWVRRFARGLLGLAGKHGVTLAGGDTGESPNGILADIIVVGGVPKGKAILRSGAQLEDRIYVSGELGGSSAALSELRAGKNSGAKKNVNPRTYPRHFYPEPRLALGCLLREKRLASAMIDLSDGLSTDLAHICEESGVGAEIDAALVPRARVGNPRSEVDLDLALHGGEDYELLFTVSSNRRVPSRIAGVAVTEVGRITRSRKILLRTPDGARQLVPHGWEHFRQ
jgi:thiamine-monophosphate kinase